MSNRRNRRILKRLREMWGDDRPTTKRAALEARRKKLLKELDCEDFYGLNNKVKAAVRGLRNLINKAGMFFDNRYGMLMGGESRDSDIVLFDYGTGLEIYYRQSFVLDMEDHESVTNQLRVVDEAVSDQMIRSTLFPNEYTTRTRDMVVKDGELQMYNGGFINTTHGKKMVKKIIRDDVPAMVHNHEFVWRQSAVRGIGCGSVARGATILYALMDIYAERNKHYPYLSGEDDEWQFEYNPEDDETE